MTLADRFTSVRLILAPAFFAVYFLPRFFSAHIIPAYTVPVLLIIFIVSEVTDLLDGIVARKMAEVSDFGKLYDPFADTLTQITYFLCFVIDGILSPLLFLLVLYREFSILFLRNLMLKKGIALGARMSGKVKTVFYISAASLALLVSCAMRLGLGGEFLVWLAVAAKVVFLLAVIIAVTSFIEYVFVYIKTPKKAL